ncbi:hypothetical protein CAEBREN_17352 [Caenorhabditis brenneri]|uniref:Uncharacterized protein n=1 Tax=Caenorhabditis brenneri TaxID=135651 RepID=G0NDG1_CAEBE|nr:hypothetical protein CAEBREN_17352 [Caenorhabditis brenneri]
MTKPPKARVLWTDDTDNLSVDILEKTMDGRTDPFEIMKIKEESGKLVFQHRDQARARWNRDSEEKRISWRKREKMQDINNRGKVSYSFKIYCYLALIFSAKFGLPTPSRTAYQFIYDFLQTFEGFKNDNKFIKEFMRTLLETGEKFNGQHSVRCDV